MKIAILIFATISLTSCDPVKRHQRLVNNYPYVHVNKTDTIRIKDSIKVVIPTVKTDTFFLDNRLNDTVYITKVDSNGVTIRYIRIKDSIYLASSVKPRTIYVPFEKVVIKTVTHSEKPKNNWLKALTGISVFLLIILVLLFLFVKLVKSTF